MTLEQLRVFVKVVQAGSFTRAADTLGVQKSYASRVVSGLERELGVKLLERTTRTLSVTEAGREICVRATGILDAVDDTSQFAQNLRGEPRGKLRLTCGVEFGMLVVGEWIDEYLALNPKTQVEAEYTSRVLDIVHEGFDLAIRVGRIEQSRLVARPLGELEYGLFACPRYLAAQGRPEDLDALRAHSLVTFSGGSHRKGWSLQRRSSGELLRFDVPARLAVNNSFAVRDALLRSRGIGPLPLLVARDALAAGRLVPVLEELQPQPVPVSVVYPSNRYLSPKVRSFIDLIVKRFPEATAAARSVAEHACAKPQAKAGTRRRR